ICVHSVFFFNATATTQIYTLSLHDALPISGLVGGIVGHVGDGNYHVIIMIDLDDPDEVKRAEHFNEFVVEYALKRGGTCTGEHGVGVGKLKYQKAEHGAAYELMKKIKRALDPHNLFNPGKLIK